MATLDHMLEPDVMVRRLEVITGTGRRRRFSDDDKVRIVEETLLPGAVVSEVARRHGLMPQQVFTWRRQAPSPSDPETLKAMLLAERCESERLRQIIKEMQRHRFGRKAEALPEEQMLLGLEDVEQVAASAEAEQDESVPDGRAARARKRRSNRGALPARLPRIEVVVRYRKDNDLNGTLFPDRLGSRGPHSQRQANLRSADPILS